MHKNPGLGKLFWIISILLMVGISATLNSLSSGQYVIDKESEEIFKSVNEDEKVQLYVGLKNYDAASQTLNARLWFQPPKDYATFLGDSVQAKVDTRIQVSASKIDHNNSDNSWYWTATEFIRAIDVELDADNFLFESRTKDIWFPFDRYSSTLTGLVQVCVQGCETEEASDDEWKNLPVEIVPYTASLPGWSSTFSLKNFDGESKKETFLNSGEFFVGVSIYRTPLNIALTLLISLIFIGGGLSMLLLFRSILLNHRPPTLSGLIWAGSTAFTMIQTRGVIPGAPRIGVKFDLFIFYPSLILCFVSGGLMFYHWISKDTWSREL